MKLKNFFEKNLVPMIFFGGMMLLGLFYPSMTRNKLEEVLLNGSDNEPIVIGLVGTVFFVVAGIIAQKLLVAVLHEKNSGSSCSFASFTAVLFGLAGASYNAIAVINCIEKDFGILGKYAIEENNLGFVKPLSTVLLIISIVLLTYLLLLCFKENKDVDAFKGKKVNIVNKIADDSKRRKIIIDEKRTEEPNIKEKRIVDTKPEFKTEKTDHAEKEFIEEVSASTSRLKSTMRTPTAESTTEGSDKFTPAGDL